MTNPYSLDPATGQSIGTSSDWTYQSTSPTPLTSTSFPLTPVAITGDPFCTDPYCDPLQEGNSITVCRTFVPPFEIDGGSAPLALNVQGLEASITSVEVTISFTNPGRFGGFPPALH